MLFEEKMQNIPKGQLVHDKGIAALEFHGQVEELLWVLIDHLDGKVRGQHIRVVLP